MAVVLLGLGSNLGDREYHLDQALKALRATPGIRLQAISPLLEFPPVGGPPGQDLFLNGTAQIETTLSPRELLTALQTIERRLGRLPGEARWSPRTIDLDILLYDEQVVQEPDVMIPHPLMHERLFVLEPLGLIAPRARHPLLRQTVEEMLHACIARQGAK
ncbi:MAG: 2-amino-4-hydroxy-6-hydroxymethyldihydropteridine diphosphokinase [Candidatus Omnitrophica bacterium]|nr:2-amino-4-hydroxy-6-hydroxymethyldihydropteridine diphosphokinase [Candidatus Omnitrophota bacterium]